jgi:methylthioribose-1-phosphate isomerase
MEDDELKMIDQRLLPDRFEILRFREVEEVGRAIKNMTVRGAPAIGAAAAYGMALAALQGKDLRESAELLKSQRPTSSMRSISWWKRWQRARDRWRLRTSIPARSSRNAV